jgi:putative (di)nucleoside polyphosphate hydrolase
MDLGRYRPCVGVVLFNAEGRVFLGRRAGIDPAEPLAWQWPQGGIDKGETALAAARRELYEETNVRSVALLAEHPDWLTYDFPPGMGRQAWTGQKQRWFAFRFLGTDSEIDIQHPADGHHEPEFEAWRWADLEQAPDCVVAFKRPVYQAVVEAFRPIAGKLSLTKSG